MSIASALLMLFAAVVTGAHAHAQGVATVSVASDGDHHVEPHLATNPNDSREIVVVAMRVQSTALDTWQVSAFRSADGGQSWQSSTLPARDGVRCAADPWVVWGQERSVYLVCLAPVPTADGKDFDFETFLYRSRDGGQSWLPPLQVPVDTAGSWDHPVVTRVPAGSSGERDVVWIAGTRGRRGGNGFGVIPYSADGERFGTFRLYRPPNAANDIFAGAVALGGGRLLFTYYTMSEQPPRPLYAVHLTDEDTAQTRVRDSVTPWGFPMLGASATPAPQRPVYSVWLEGTQAGGLHVMLARSSDEGRSWSTPVVVTREDRAVFRTRPNVAVDARGAVAVTWFESTSGDNCGDVRLRVLADGGTRVLHERRFPRGDTACPRERPLGGIVERWRGGGDYSGILSPAPGVFDLVWADAREDGHQVRFARVRIDR
ncbi:MAG TPA: hypothetical protein VJ803_11370 [Gemmatimonadaceae bacterium]|nr:hypothetical protein [Gemmatimonadaceae bacterium]